MKNAILLLIAACTIFIASAQSNCLLVINGKEFSSGSKITKNDLLKFCPLKIKDSKTGATIDVASVKWVISHNGQVFSGTAPTDCTKLIKFANQITSGDIIFIDEIKCKETARCRGQYVLKLE